MDKAALAWAAGIFEGEGCFTSNMGRSKDLYPTAIVGMLDEDVIRKFHQVVGVGHVRCEGILKGHTRPRWRWSVTSFEKFQQIVCYFWPWLCSRRRAKVKELMQRYHEVTAARNSGLMGNRRKRRVLHPINH